MLEKKRERQRGGDNVVGKRKKERKIVWLSFVLTVEFFFAMCNSSK
jgi:hypothetical protein